MSIAISRQQAKPRRPKKGDPTWELVQFFPRQGAWTETEYFALDTNRLVELDQGFLEVLPMPTVYHQRIALFLYELLKDFLKSLGKGGVACVAPVPIRLWPEQIREPDVFYISRAHLGDPKKTTNKIDLAMEVVSEGEENRERDYQKKRRDYAKARVPEYWIVDPEEKKITVLILVAKRYRVHGVFGPGTIATSKLLFGFTIPVDDCFAAGDL